MSSPGLDLSRPPVLAGLLDEFVLRPQGPDSRPPPGAVLGVSTATGRWIAARGQRQVLAGDGALEHPLPMTATSAHDLGSLTKVVATTTAVLALADHGELSLDAPLSALLPAAAGSWLRDVTCRELLRHRAGLWEWWPTYVSADSSEAAIDLVLELPARYPVGAQRHYSDLGFMLLGAVLSRSRSLPEAVQALVLSPLGLRNTSYGRPHTDDVAAGAPGDLIERRMLASGEPYPVPIDPGEFSGWRTGVRVGEVDDGNAFHAFGGAAGHAGLFSTAGDLLDWGEALLRSVRGEGPWRRETVEEFFAPGPDEGQRLGFRSWTTRSGACVADAFGHPGFPGTVGAVLPAHGAVVVLLTNRLHLDDPNMAVTTEAMWHHTLDSVHRLFHQVHDASGREDEPCG